MIQTQEYPVAIITGANRGIGRAFANYFADKRYRVVLIARNQESLNSVADDLIRKYDLNTDLQPLVYALDITHQEKVEATVIDVFNQTNRIDILVNNAGILRVGTSEANYHDFKEVIETNLVGLFSFCHAVVPLMKKKKTGYIFNISSMAGQRGLARLGAYCASKFGVVGFSESLFKELLPYNIRVTAICPSVVATEMTADFDFLPEDMIQTDDLTKTVDYLLSLSKEALVKDILVRCRLIEMNPL